MLIPDNLKYTKDHEWVLIDGTTATIGVTDYAQEHLGDIVYVELPEVGADFTKGDTFGVLEYVKAVSDCFVPISGNVLEANDVLTENPETVNEDCYGDGWLIAVAVSDDADLSEHLDAAAYRRHVEERGQE